MFKMSRLLDYSLVILENLNGREGRGLSATELAKSTKLPLPTVRKVLKILLDGGLLRSVRGVQGGYRLVLLLEHITLLRLTEVVDGQFALMQCCDKNDVCDYASDCRVSSGWQRVDALMQEIFRSITLKNIIECTGALHDLQSKCTLSPSVSHCSHGCNEYIYQEGQ